MKLAFLKTLTNSKSCPESRIKFLFMLSFALIGQFSLVYIHSRLSEQFSKSQAGFGTNFKDTGGYQKAGTSSLKRVTGRNFTISKLFHWSKHKLENHIQKVLFGFLGPSKEIFISWHYPFKIYVQYLKYRTNIPWTAELKYQFQYTCKSELGAVVKIEFKFINLHDTSSERFFDFIKKTLALLPANTETTNYLPLSLSLWLYDLYERFSWDFLFTTDEFSQWFIKCTRFVHAWNHNILRVLNDESCVSYFYSILSWLSLIIPWVKACLYVRNNSNTCKGKLI